MPNRDFAWVDRATDITAGLLWPRGPGWQLEDVWQQAFQMNGHLHRGNPVRQNPAYRPSAYFIDQVLETPPHSRLECEAPQPEVPMSIVEEIALRQSVRIGLLIVGLIAALIYAVGFCHQPASRWKTVIKAVPMPAFAAALAVSFGASMVVWALILSAVGDIALSRDGPRNFLIGLIGFALAHVVYVFYFFSLGGGVFSVPMMYLALLVAFAVSTEWWLTPYTGALRWPVRIYVAVIALMAATALNLPMLPMATLGAVAFLASDALLAVHLFRMAPEARAQRVVSVVLWVLYVGGQFGIVAGAGWRTPLF